MRFVILQAHPLEDCLNVTLRDRAAGALSDAGHEVQVVRVSQGEWVSAASLADADGLVFVYPTWWGGLPSPLLDWVQRELGAWIDRSADMSDCPLRGVVRLAAITTHGSPRRVNWMQGEPGRILLKGPVARLCAAGTRLRWIALYGLDQSAPPRIAGFVDRAAGLAVSLGGT